MSTGPQRDVRDQQAKAWHDQAVAGGQKRLLRRASTGELVSYLPEEYGVGRTGIGPKITTVWGHAVLVASQVLILVLFFYGLSIGVQAGHTNVPVGLWIVVAFMLLILAYTTWNLVKEAKATALRRQRGLPTPAE
ncbi:hypothetical protein [Arthrobacter cryoconiti]|uniref:Integral membrane protein n=1 Tax=Arthrobacter cryoconiti TaxID=748907 RepID=A0ABV8R035_9MICC|nr:hypothetical protein [Arthrobacter cryoconiti]MCC9069916.1 hypothetical protein [Arthrobacter cryoconiti]